MEKTILGGGLSSFHAGVLRPLHGEKEKGVGGEQRMMKEKGKEARTKILLIGENPDIQLFTALQREGYEAIACESPQKASVLVYAFQPRLIIVHLRHPSRNNLATLQECRAVAEGIPIVVATSVPGHETVMRALEEGATSFLSLPVEGAKIKKVVDDLVASQR